MKRRPLTRHVFLLFMSVVLAHTLVQAGVTGKISGVVKDGITGVPLIGATVRVSGTDLIAMTDDEGEYFIINVPSGKYDVAVTHVGFEVITKKDVRVLLDLTTPVDFTLKQVTIELKQDMVIYATSPAIQRDLTSSKAIFTADRLRNLPNVNTVQNVLSNYPGVVIDKGRDLHVRGGRAGQINYLYDGFVVVDPFVSNLGMRIMPTALEELSLTSGGFTAEYGEALSGIVNAVSAEGTSRFKGRVRMYEGATEAYDVSTARWGGLTRQGNRAISAAVSGPIPGFNPDKYTFSASGEYLKDNGYLPHSGATNWSGSGKLAMQPSSKVKLIADFAYNHGSGDVYQHRDVNGRSYDFDLSGLPSFRRTAYLAGLTMNYSITAASILSASVNRFSTIYKQAPQNLFDVYWDQWPGYPDQIHSRNYLNYADNTDPYQATGFTKDGDFNPAYQRREAAYNAVAVSYLSQVNKANQVKLGLDLSKYDVDWDSKQFYNANPYGEKYTSKPLYVSFYAQDKLEYTDYVVNLGLRFDYRDPDVSYNTRSDLKVPVYEAAKTNSRISPRLGVAFPVTEKSVMHFNYGVYYAQPRYTYMYTNLQGDRSTGYPLLGNPNLKPEQTTSYELGLKQMLTENLTLDATAYYKDISDLVTTRSYDKVAGRTVTLYDNGDYGSVKGFDITLEKLALNSKLSGSVSYSYMIAMGKGASATDAYYTYLTSTTDTLAPVKEYRLDFDQRHTLTTVLSYRVPLDWKGSFMGMDLPSGWGLGFIGYFGSGLPYTKTDANGNRLGERNEGQLPVNYRVDLRFNKDFSVGLKKSLLTFFIEVDNLFDRRNVLNVYSRTGLANSDGVATSSNDPVRLLELQRLDRLYDHDPQNYSAPRTIRTGLEFGL